MSKLILIDGMAVIHRAYHALPPMTTREGQPINAVYGFTTMLLRIVDELKPDYLVVAFDLPQPTFRRELYVAYQANRPHPDEGLASQFGLVRELVEAADIPLLAMPGFEADDIIGTLSRQCISKLAAEAVEQRTKNKEEKVDEVLIITGDRDMMQLVNKKVKLYMPVKGLSESKVVNEAGVLDYWDVTPSQIVDLKALIGDSSDNYPGVPGIGPKTAAMLLQKFGTLENIYKSMENARFDSARRGKWKMENISEGIAKKLVDGYDSAMLSKKLATIVCDVPVNFDLKDATVEDFKTSEKFIKKLQQFQFRSLLARVGSIPEKVKEKKIENSQMGLI